MPEPQLSGDPCRPIPHHLRYFSASLLLFLILFLNSQFSAISCIPTCLQVLSVAPGGFGRSWLAGFKMAVSGPTIGSIGGGFFPPALPPSGSKTAITATVMSDNHTSSSWARKYRGVCRFSFFWFLASPSEREFTHSFAFLVSGAFLPLFLHLT